MIKTKSVSFRVGQRYLVHKADLEARQGELLVIIGPNGAGKSTLLKLLSRELKPSDGSILMNGKEISSYSNKEMAAFRSVLCQHNRVSLPFAAEEIVMMGRYPFFGDHPTDHDYDLVEACLADVDALHLKSQPYPVLSGGEKQRIQLARSLAQICEADNGILLLDEPTTGLDLKHQYHTLKIAKSWAAKGYCVVAILHDLNLALQFADRVIMMKEGQLLYNGSSFDVLTEENIEEVFQIPVRIYRSDTGAHPVIMPVADVARHYSL